MSFDGIFGALPTHPQEIEDKSFSIITEEFGEHPFSAGQFAVVRRVIHASADFELGRSMVFHALAVESGIRAIRAGRAVVADVQMVQAGVSKPRIAKYGGDVHVHISDPDVMADARRLNTTRAIMAVRKACALHEDAIFAIGNAPTALLELIRLVREGSAHPSLIIGVPVGFVSAAEAKEALLELDVPFITNRGRKGGSPAAVAVLNALSLLADAADE